MKVKARPEDFVVQEVSDAAIRDVPAEFRIYRLRKRSWDTFDLVDLLRRRLNLGPSDISYGGIKDRHGETEQILSLRNLPRLPARIEEKNFSLQAVGYADRPVTARGIRGNRFRLVLRDIRAEEVPAMQARLDQIGRFGVPNYYDEQRFGSARHGQGFMGREVLLGNRERAMRLFFEPSRFDPPRERKLKRSIVDHWGRWEQLRPDAFGVYRRVLDLLCEDGFAHSYTRALGVIEKSHLLLVINAYQSYLFNEVLRRWLAGLAERHGLALWSSRYQAGEFLFYGALPADLAADMGRTELPVPAYDTRVADPAIGAILAEVLAAEQIRQEQLRVRKIPGLSIHATYRRAVLMPEDLVVREAEEDDLYPGRLKLGLDFFLPRGGYATLILKRVAG